MNNLTNTSNSTISTKITYNDLIKLQQSFDDNVNYIDGYSQYKNVIKRNEEISEMLAYFGYDTKMNKIEPKIKRLYKSSDISGTSLGEAIARATEIFNRVRDSKNYPAGEEMRKEVLQKHSYYQIIDFVPVLENGYFKFQEVIRTRKIKDLE